MLAWYVVRLKSGQESTAKHHLLRQGFTAYVPYVYADTRKKARKTEPMFPGYGFVHLSDQQGDWSKIRSTIGVIGLVKFGDKPAPIADSIIEHLISRENEEGLHGQRYEYHEGDRVQIDSGPFRFYEAVIQSHKNQRITLLIEMIGRSMTIQARPQDISPV